MKVTAVSTIFSTFGCLCLLHCVVWGEAKPVPAQELIAVELFKFENHGVGNLFESKLKKCENLNFNIGSFTHVAFTRSAKLVKDPCVRLCNKPCGAAGEMCVELSARDVLYPLTLLENQVKSISRCLLKSAKNSKETVNDYYDTKDRAKDSDW